MEHLLHIFIHTFEDSLPMLPFLFAAFLLLEALEHYSAAFFTHTLPKFQKMGPLAGAFAGCIPQCGVSSMAANLYSGGILSVGTLLAVFLSTSDEAILILLGHPGNGSAIARLLIAKILLAIVFGYVTDLCLSRYITVPKQIGDLCTRSHCGCSGHHGLLRPALNHTFKLFGYILLFSGILNLLIHTIGLEMIAAYLLKGSIFQPFFAALIGLIPNCASSILLTELYVSNVLTFASTVAGLSSNAGIGLVVLFRMNQNKMENRKILGLLYAVSVVAGLILNLFAF